jgi:MFS family permease
MPQAIASSTPSVVSDPADEVPQIEKVVTEPQLPAADIGFTPWLQVLGGFFLMFNSWGILVSYGSFQAYYTSGGGITDEHNPSNIAWIGSVEALLTLLGAALAGKWFDAGYFRFLAIIGTFFTVFGLMMTSLATKYYQVMLAQGVVTGAGMALFCVTSVALPSTWFVAHRGLAVGIVSTGASVAGIIYPIMFHQLLPQVGFPWTVRIMGFLVLGTLMISIAVLRQRLPPKKRAGLLDWESFKQVEFALYTAGIFVSFLGFFNLLSYVQPWITAEDLDTKGLPAFYVLPIINAASIIGRTVPNYISDHIGPLNVQVPGSLIAGILVLCWLPVHSIGGLLTIGILYGIFSGTLISILPPAIASMTSDMTRFGARTGVIFAALAFGSLIGTPVTGALVQSQHGSYDGARIWSGVCLVAGSVLIFFSRMIKAHWALMVKV